MNKTRMLLFCLICSCLLISEFALGQNRSRRPVIANNPMRVDPAEYLDKINLPPGFKIEMYAENVTNPRSLALGKDGTLFVGTRRQRRSITGKVYAIVDNNKDNKADQVITIADSLT